MSAATPLLVADVLDVFARGQNRRGNHFEFIAVLMSRYEGGFSEDRIKQLYRRQGKKSTLSAIRDYLVKTHGGLAGGPYKTFAKLRSAASSCQQLAQQRPVASRQDPVAESGASRQPVGSK
jgi:hypothetical protein